MSRLSVPGLLVFLAGMVVLWWEWNSDYLRERLSVAGLGGLGATLAYLFGTLAVAVGLQQVIKKALGQRKATLLTRDRFYAPMAGRVFVVILIALFVGSFMGKSNPLLLVFCLMAPLLVFNGFISFTQLRRVSVKREPPERAEAGRVTPVTIRMTGLRSRMTVWMMTVTDQIEGPDWDGPRMRQPLKPMVAFLKIPAGESVRRTYRVRLPLRGRYRVGPLQVDTRFPLGLVERGLIVGEAQELLVHPRVGRVSPNWRKTVDRRREQVAGLSRQAGSFDDDFHRVRDYQTGDDPRAIHWATTARRGSLVVREFRESRDRPLAILVDLWSEDGRSTADVERALELTATIAADHTRNSQRSALYVGLLGNRLIEWDSSTKADFGSLLDVLAVAAAGAEASADDLLTVWRDRQKSHERVVWVTTRGTLATVGEGPGDMQVLTSDEATVSAVAYFE